jgi:hypothetical protein
MNGNYIQVLTEARGPTSSRGDGSPPARGGQPPRPPSIPAGTLPGAIPCRRRAPLLGKSRDITAHGGAAPGQRPVPSAGAGAGLGGGGLPQPGGSRQKAPNGRRGGGTPEGANALISYVSQCNLGT